MFDVALFYGGVEYTDRKSYLELGALMHEKGRDVSQPLEGLLLAHNGCQQEGHCSSTAIACESSDDLTLIVDMLAKLRDWMASITASSKTCIHTA